MKIVIDKMLIKCRKKDGSPYIDKNGNPYRLISIKSEDNWYSCFEKKGITDKWHEGDTIDVEVKDSNGYKNIVLPSQKVAREEIDEIKKRLNAIEAKLTNKLPL